MDLDGQSFFIVNKQFPYAKLTQWGTEKPYEIGTNELSPTAADLWMLQSAPGQSDCYYIHNLKYDGFRIKTWYQEFPIDALPPQSEQISFVKSGTTQDDVYMWLCGRSKKDAEFLEGDDNYSGGVGVFKDGALADDQIWKFEQTSSGHYIISIKDYPAAKMTKWQAEKITDGYGLFLGTPTDAELWTLKPRFDATVKWNTIWSYDNRKGTTESGKQTKTVTEGLKLTSTASLTTKKGFKQSLKASLTAGIPSAGLGLTVESTTEFTNQVDSYVSSGEEKTWSRSWEENYSAPAGKLRVISQLGCVFESPIGSDNCSFSGGTFRQEDLD